MVVTIAIVLVLLLIAFVLYKSYFVKERQQIVMELCGKYTHTLKAGPHFALWPLYSPKTYSWKYFLTQGNNVGLSARSANHVLTKSDEWTFRQDVISRDNAGVTLDAVMGYRISNAKKYLQLPELAIHAGQVVQAGTERGRYPDVDSIVDDTQHSAASHSL